MYKICAKKCKTYFFINLQFRLALDVKARHIFSSKGGGLKGDSLTAPHLRHISIE